MLKKIITTAFVLSLLGLFAGCEGTLKGMGEDIEKMGKSLKDSVGSDKESDSK